MLTNVSMCMCANLTYLYICSFPPSHQSKTSPPQGAHWPMHPANRLVRVCAQVCVRECMCVHILCSLCAHLQEGFTCIPSVSCSTTYRCALRYLSEDSGVCVCVCVYVCVCVVCVYLYRCALRYLSEVLVCVWVVCVWSPVQVCSEVCLGR